MARSWVTIVKDALDPTTRRSLIVEANDGIIATAGVIEGFAGAGATGAALVVAAVSTMAAGAVAICGARYAEEAAEHDAQQAIVREEQRLLALSPADELVELALLYEAKGLSPTLARQVAEELSSADALAAHVEAEFGLLRLRTTASSVIVALTAGVAFALGAVVPLLAVVLVRDEWRALATFVSSLVALAITSTVLAYFGHMAVRRVLVRTIVVAVSAMGLSLLVGSLLDL